MKHLQQRVLVTAIIIEDGKILMQRRGDKIKTHEGKWTTPSGLVEINEHPKDTIIREVKEELDVNISVNTLIPLVDSFPHHKDKFHLVYLSYLCSIIGGTVKNIDQDDDILEVKWLDIKTIDHDMLIRGTWPPVEYAFLHMATTQ